jgi:hypothetical protein
MNIQKLTNDAELCVKTIKLVTKLIAHSFENRTWNLSGLMEVIMNEKLLIYLALNQSEQKDTLSLFRTNDMKCDPAHD